jgi:ABC-2 type transport system ATP-binding protein
VTGFLGPNAAGKTTTLRVLLGLAAPTQGTGVILGTPYARLADPLRRVGALLEITGFHPGRSGRDHLRVCALQGGLGPARVDVVLAQVGMDEAADRRVGGYSLGMRQRLGLATALLGDPEILVLDEPGNGLDPAGVAWLRGFLRAYAEAGRTVLVSSHVLAEIAQVADQLVVIDRGRLVVAGPVDEITRGSGSAVRVRTPNVGRLSALLLSEGADVLSADGDALDVTGIAIERVGELAAADGIVLHELSRREASLEQAFLALTGSTEPSADAPLPPPPGGGA